MLVLLLEHLSTPQSVGYHTAERRHGPRSRRRLLIVHISRVNVRQSTFCPKCTGILFTPIFLVDRFDVSPLRGRYLTVSMLVSNSCHHSPAHHFSGRVVDLIGVGAVAVQIQIHISTAMETQLSLILLTSNNRSRVHPKCRWER